MRAPFINAHGRYAVAAGCILAAVLCFVPPALGETLQEAVQATLKTNPEVLIEVARRRAAGETLKQAWGGYLPKIDLNLAKTDSNSDQGPNAIDSQLRQFKYDRSLTLTQMLFDGFSTSSDVNHGRAVVESASHKLASTSEQIAIKAIENYLEVLRLQEVYRMTEENLAAHERTLDQIKLRASSGVGRKSDQDQIESRVALVRSNLLSAEANLKVAEINYQLVVGVKPGTLVKPKIPDPILIPPSPEEAIPLAFDNNRLIKSARADVNAAIARHQGSKSAMYPKVNLEMGVVRNNTVDNLNGTAKADDKYAKVNMSFNLFSGGSNRASIAENSYNLEEARETLHRTERQLEQTVRISWTNHRSAEDRLPSLAQHAESSALTRDAYVKQFTMGQRTLLDLLDTENEAYTAGVNYVNGIYAELLSDYRVLTDVGILMETLGISHLEEAEEDPEARATMLAELKAEKEERAAKQAKAEELEKAAKAAKLKEEAKAAIEARIAAEKLAMEEAKARAKEEQARLKAEEAKAAEEAKQPAKAELPALPILPPPLSSSSLPPAVTPEMLIERSVKEWAAAWSAKNVHDYVAAYVPDFKPKGMSHDAWKKQRVDRISKSKIIEVILSDISTNAQDDNHATVSFTQSYRADAYHSKTEKTLRMIKQLDRWLITEESAGRVVKVNAEAKAAEQAKAEEEARAAKQAKEEARAQAKTEAEAKAAEQARLKAEAKAKVEEEARAAKQAKAETETKAEEDARLKAEAKAKAEEEARAAKQAKEEAKAQAKAEAEAKTAEQAKLKAEAKARAEEEARAAKQAKAEAKAKDKLRAAEAAKAAKEVQAKLKILIPLANKGDALAQLRLGEMNDMGQGIPQNYQKAVARYRQAAEQGNAEAQYHLGEKYELGQGVPQSYTVAAEWYSKAAEQEQKNIKKVQAKAGANVIEEARAKPAEAQTSPTMVGTAGTAAELQAALNEYQSGNYPAALTALIPLANKGDAIAQLRLGVMNEMGQGIPQSYKKAVVRYRQAAEQGNAEAQYRLGEKYELGQGVPQNEKIAAEWYGKSANQGYAEAQTKVKADEEARIAKQARAEEQAKLKAEAKAKADEEARAAKQAKAEAKARAKEEAKAKARAAAEAKAKAEEESRAAEAAKAAEELAKTEEKAKKTQAKMEAKAKADEEARAAKQAKAEAKARAREEAKAKAKAAAEAKAKAEEESRAAEAAKAAEKARVEAEAKAAEELAKAEEKAKKAQAKIEAEAKAAEQAKLKAEADAVEQARAEEQAKLKAEAKAKADEEARAAKQAKIEAKAQAKAEAEAKKTQARIGAEAKTTESASAEAQDYKRTMDLYLKVAEQGNAEAQNSLGVMYAYGQGVPRDDKAAVYWYRKAAEQGNAEAQNNLGMMYYYGRGVPQNYAVAASWYRKATKQKHVDTETKAKE